jgi:Xaa-Pro dipeptidase
VSPINQHFSLEEFRVRQSATREELAARGLDGLLLFKIEDMYWLSGLDTDGFCVFHAMFLGTGGGMTHISRTADLANIHYSSICEDIRLWVDGADTSKSATIKDTLASHNMAGRRLGIQLDTMGLTPQLYRELVEPSRASTRVKSWAGFGTPSSPTTVIRRRIDRRSATAPRR